ncbi:protein of unknown function [Methanoculleus bourgensis]|uniref:Uncharacterized protein n=1 Tax=Methanoculleus bourgensis TaxID=83986 RepID=A0A0X3BJ92_9EURY|nr:protein of unknown function [Methanoculleus bourgensis]
MPAAAGISLIALLQQFLPEANPPAGRFAGYEKASLQGSVSFHLILSMQYHLTRRARSREVRLLGGIVPFAFFASSREVAIARPASGPAT